MARGGSRGRRSSYVRDNSGRFASSPGGGPPKRSTPASRRAARAKVTGGTLGARSSLRRSRAKLAGKNPADRSLQGSLSLRAQKGAVTRGANRLGKVRAASTVRMAARAGVIRGGRKVAAKPVAAASKPSTPARKPAALKWEKPAGSVGRQTASLPNGRRVMVTTGGKRTTATIIDRKGDPVMGRKDFRNVTEAKKWAARPSARGPRILGRYQPSRKRRKSWEMPSDASKPFIQGKKARPSGTLAKPRGLRPGAIAARKGKPVAPKSIASQKADLEKIIYNGSNSLELRKAARDKIFKLDPSYSLEPGRQKFPPKQLSAAEKAANATAAASEQRRKEFTASMSRMQGAKANAALEKYTVNNGSGVVRQALIEDMVSKGYKVQTQNGKRRLVGPGGAYFEQSALTKTGLDYAAFLAKSAAAPRKPSPKGAGPRMKAARPAGTVVKPKGLKVGAIAGRRKAKQAAASKPVKAKAAPGKQKSTYGAMQRARQNLSNAESSYLIAARTAIEGKTQAQKMKGALLAIRARKAANRAVAAINIYNELVTPQVQGRRITQIRNDIRKGGTAAARFYQSYGGKSGRSGYFW